MFDHFRQILRRLGERGAFEERPPLSPLARIVAELRGESDGGGLDFRFAVFKCALDRRAERYYVQFRVLRKQPQVEVVLHPAVQHA